MQSKLDALHRVSTPVVAVMFALVLVVFPVLYRGIASAAGQIQSRSIELSDSSPSNNALVPTGVGSGTSVSYKVTFTPATSGSIQDLIVDICDNTPLIGDTSCTYPTNFDWGGATPTLDGASLSGMGAGTWVASGIQNGAGAGKAQTLRLQNTTAPQSFSTGTPVTFTITSVTNPSTTNHSFYARILDWASDANYTTDFGSVTGTTRPSSFANNVDYGGVALSTATVITITARVMESLTFCTAGGVASIANNCASISTTPTITLGHGTNNVLDSSAVDTKSIYAQVSSNAQSGVIIRMHSANACGGLSKDGGTTCPIAPAGATLITINPGDPKIGMFVVSPSSVSGTATIASKYDGSATTTYAMDATTANNNVTYTYGDQVASTSGAINSVNLTFTFAASASNTTPAGIYTNHDSLIATGTF